MNSSYDAAGANATGARRARIDRIEGCVGRLDAMDFEAVRHFLHDDAHYRDEPSHDMDTVGPAEITANLTNGNSGPTAFLMLVDSWVTLQDKILYETDGPIVGITLHRPDRLNALDLRGVGPEGPSRPTLL